jgi:chromosome segregation ATPase
MTTVVDFFAGLDAPVKTLKQKVENLQATSTANLELAENVRENVMNSLKGYSERLSIIDDLQAKIAELEKQLHDKDVDLGIEREDKEDYMNKKLDLEKEVGVLSRENQALRSDIQNAVLAYEALKAAKESSDKRASDLDQLQLRLNELEAKNKEYEDLMQQYSNYSVTYIDQLGDILTSIEQVSNNNNQINQVEQDLLAQLGGDKVVNGATVTTPTLTTPNSATPSSVTPNLTTPTSATPVEIIPRVITPRSKTPITTKTKSTPRRQPVLDQ